MRTRGAKAEIVCHTNYAHQRVRGEGVSVPAERPTTHRQRVGGYPLTAAPGAASEPNYRQRVPSEKPPISPNCGHSPPL